MTLGEMKRRERGFSLVEVLASVLVLCSASLAVTAGWRLADYKELVTRLDDRAGRILRECCEMQTFAPARSKPFKSDGSPNDRSAVQGFLYHPWTQPNAGTQEGKGYLDMAPYRISISSDGKSMELRYELPGFGKIRQQSMRFSATFSLPAVEP